MKCLPCLTLWLLLIAGSLPAQEGKVVVSTNKNTRGEETSLVFTANNQSVARQTIILELEGGRYGRADGGLPVIRVLQPGTNRLLTLSELQQSPGYGFTWVSGCLETRPSPVTYLLPVAPGKSTKIDTLYNVEETYLGKASPKNWSAYALTAQPGDTIYASRRGMVIEVEESMPRSTTEGISYASARNFVVVEHEDCTRGRYELFAENAVAPQPGEWVEAGSPLGTVMDGSNYLNGTQIRFSVYYPDITRTMMQEMRKFNNITYPNAYVKPAFYGVKDLRARSTYRSEHPESVIFQEMSKRDIKKWKKAQGR